MKKTSILIAIILIVFVGFSSNAQRSLSTPTSAGGVLDASALVIQDEPDSWFNSMSYSDVKMMLQRSHKPNRFEVINKNLQALNNSKDEDITEAQVKNLENLVLDLYSLDNKQVGELLKMSRKENLGLDQKLEKQIDTYIQLADETYKENIFLAQLNPKNIETNNMLLKRSFSDFFEGVIDYAECLVCCSKTSFPDERLFLNKPKYGKQIKTSKAEYSAWYSNKLCGFVVYDFPVTFKKARYKPLSFPGLMLWMLAGRPRFKNLAPNGTEVHVPILPVIIVLGLRDLATPPCQNKELQSKLLKLVQVRK